MKVAIFLLTLLFLGCGQDPGNSNEPAVDQKADAHTPVMVDENGQPIYHDIRQ